MTREGRVSVVVLCEDEAHERFIRGDFSTRFMEEFEWGKGGD